MTPAVTDKLGHWLAPGQTVKFGKKLTRRGEVTVFGHGWLRVKEQPSGRMANVKPTRVEIAA